MNIVQHAKTFPRLRASHKNIGFWICAARQALNALFIRLPFYTTTKHTSHSPTRQKYTPFDSLLRFFDPTSWDARRCLYFHVTGCASIRRCDSNWEYWWKVFGKLVKKILHSEGLIKQSFVTDFFPKNSQNSSSQNKLWNGGVLESGHQGNLKPNSRNKSFRTRRFKDTDL